ncbi:tetratricopeptide repeat-containing sensor histidine kinase [Fulvivirga ulvae]|uniref:tetratricopeptide repeat-containing sensor histidine kinase n=1 Tax=Fulvivirga ulvae TaxID=2904245 RepID=UPI001F1F95FE|nr:tetratricopeptide repeat protein [Fulvivirga ulvae]UII33217.1 tetratricopeptide repeat-containing sensor histidine kinase [Fulvivirga ulvae]
MSNRTGKVIIVLLMLLRISMPVEAQEVSLIDSLRTKLEQVADTTRIDVLFILSMKYQHFKPDSAMYFAKQALKEAETVEYPKGQGDALISIGRLKRDKGNYSEALEDIFRSLKIYQSIADSIQIGNAFNDISIVYAYSGDYDKSLVYFEQALVIFQQTGNEKGVSQALNNIGLIYLEKNDLEKAEEYMLRSLSIKKKRNDLQDISSGYANLGSVMEQSGQKEKALHYYKQANDLFLQTNNKTGLASNYIAVARLELDVGNISQANNYALDALATAEEVDSKPFMEEASGLLVDIAEINEDYKAAFKYLKINSSMKDSLYNENNSRHLEELKAKFNEEENLREIALLKKDQEIQKANIRQKDILTYSLIVVIFLSLVILALVYVAYRVNKRKKEMLAFKNEKIRNQKEDLIRLNQDKDQLFSIISHDIKSPLNSLRGFSHLLINHIDKISQDEIKEMGSQINQSLENLNELLDNLLAWSTRQSGQAKLNIAEIELNELIGKNIALYNLTASFKQIRLVNDSEEHVVALADYNSVHTILRNLISNSLKFSYPNSEIVITAKQNKDYVSVTVKDDGVGMSEKVISKLFDLSKQKSQKGTSNEKGTGFGLVLCQQLVHENNGTIMVKSDVRMGSEFTFTLPAPPPNSPVVSHEAINSEA